MGINIIKPEEQEDEIKQLKDELKQAMEIVKAVAYIGVDWGCGEYELEESHIKEARRLYGIIAIKEDK